MVLTSSIELALRSLDCGGTDGVSRRPGPHHGPMPGHYGHGTMSWHCTRKTVHVPVEGGTQGLKNPCAGDYAGDAPPERFWTVPSRGRPLNYGRDISTTQREPQTAANPHRKIKSERHGPRYLEFCPPNEDYMRLPRKVDFGRERKLYFHI